MDSEVEQNVIPTTSLVWVSSDAGEAIVDRFTHVAASDDVPQLVDNGVKTLDISDGKFASVLTSEAY
jgi:hypothetical protein